MQEKATQSGTCGDVGCYIDIPGEDEVIFMQENEQFISKNDPCLVYYCNVRDSMC